MTVKLKINGDDYAAGPELGPHYSLNDYIRKSARLYGTKKMCAEGGCGACVVHVAYTDANNKSVKKSMNSCMIPVYACDGWSITTVEGLGDRKRGYHSIQKRLAEYNGTQCGFCSPGFVMNMYGILTENPKPTKQHIEDSFDGNICRCTGYRPILDAMKSFSDVNSEIPDIEEINKACCGKAGYSVCNNSCHNPEEEFETVSDENFKAIRNTEGVWHKPGSLTDMYTLLKEIKGKKVRIVVGNTGSGVFKNDGPYDHYVDPKSIPQLFEIKDQDDKLEFGAGVTLSQMISTLKTKAESTTKSTSPSSIWNYFMNETVINKDIGWQFCTALADHMRYIANTPVRNAGCWAGNLMMKHDHNDFPSDMFTIMETAGAMLTIANCDGTLQNNVAPSAFFKTDMSGKILLKLTLAKMTPNHVMRTFKITIRSQNSHAYINAGFLFEIDTSNNYKILSQPTIVFGGVNKDFIHATETEKLLNGLELNKPENVKAALEKLEAEIKPDSAPVLSSVTYRKSLCVSLLYKFILGVIGDSAASEYKSGGPNLDRPLSGGSRTFYTNEKEWPLTQPIPKLEAHIQCAGEAEYSGDKEPLRGQLYAAFVLSDVGPATITKLDTSEASKFPGVERVLTYKDVPGDNNFASGYQREELMASKNIYYNGQPVAIVLAETEYIAEKATKLVKVSYSNVVDPICDINDAINKKRFFPHSPYQAIVAGNVEDGFKNADHVVEGELGLGSQYHFHMETQTTACMPSDIGLNVYTATQDMDGVQKVIARILAVDESYLNLEVKRLGGGYGGKLDRSVITGAGCALSAYITSRPVMMHLPLETNMRMIGKRLPYVAKYKIGVTDEGKLTAVQIYYYNDAGSNANSATGATTVMFGDSSYYCKNWNLVPIPVHTDTPANTSCRAPAWLQGVTFIEAALEHVAFTLKKDPYDIKAMNLLKNGEKKAGGHVILNCLIGDMEKDFRQSIDYDNRRKQIADFNKNNRWKKKGLSVILMRYPYMYFGIHFNAMVSIYSQDGTVSISHSGIEMGQGINTKCAQVCAYELGIPLSMVYVKPTTSFIAPNSTITGGSIGSDMVCWATIKACEELKNRMAPMKKRMPTATWKQLVATCASSDIDLCARNTYSRSDVPANYDIYGATACEVEVDVLTGMVQIPRVDILYDGGNSLSPDVDIGQIEGAFMMGIGLMLSEQLKYDPKSAALLTNNTWEYKPPTTKDIPIQFNVKFVKNAKNPLGVLGSKATGEPPLCMSATALFAVRDAVQSAREDAGLTDRVTINSPATPEQIHNMCAISADRMKIQ